MEQVSSKPHPFSNNSNTFLAIHEDKTRIQCIEKLHDPCPPLDQAAYGKDANPNFRKGFQNERRKLEQGHEVNSQTLDSPNNCYKIAPEDVIFLSLLPSVLVVFQDRVSNLESCTEFSLRTEVRIIATVLDIKLQEKKLRATDSLREIRITRLVEASGAVGETAVLPLLADGEEKEAAGPRNLVPPVKAVCVVASPVEVAAVKSREIVDGARTASVLEQEAWSHERGARSVELLQDRS